MQFPARIIGIGLALLQGVSVAGDPPELKSDADRIGYSLGHQVGTDLHRQAVKADTDAILRGLEDGLAGNPPLLPEAEMQNRLQSLKHDIVVSEQEQRLKTIQNRRIKREMARKEGEAFMAANTKKTGITTLPSGLQYRVIQPGQGNKPARGDTVTVHYRSTLLDGSEFGNTRNGEPESFTVNEMIPGLQEALMMMQPGARWELFIPPELGFGRRGPLEDQTIIYDLELLAIEHSDGGKANSNKSPADQDQTPRSSYPADHNK